MPIANLDQIGPLVALKSPGAITYGDKFATIASSALQPYMKMFDNTEVAKAALKRALNGSQAVLIGELKQIHALFRIFGNEFELTGSIYNRQLQKVYSAEFALLSDAAKQRFSEENPSIDIAKCDVCLSLNGRVVPLAITVDEDDEKLLSSVDGYSPKFTLSFGVEKMGTSDVPTYTLTGTKLAYTGRVSNYREVKPGVVGISDRHPPQMVLNAIDDYIVLGTVATLKDFVRSVSTGSGKSGIPFTNGGLGIYPVVSLSVDLSADKTFTNTTVVCIGPSGETRYRLSQGQANMYALSISDSYPSTNEAGVTTTPDGLFGISKLAIAFYDTERYVAKKGKNAGNEVTRELLTVIPHEGVTFVSGHGKDWDPDTSTFVSESKQAEVVNTNIATTISNGGDDDDNGDTIIENVFATRIAQTVALVEDSPQSITDKMAKTVAVQAVQNAPAMLEDDDDEDGASIM